MYAMMEPARMCVCVCVCVLSFSSSLFVGIQQNKRQVHLKKMHVTGASPYEQKSVLFFFKNPNPPCNAKPAAALLWSDTRTVIEPSSYEGECTSGFRTLQGTLVGRWKRGMMDDGNEE